VKAVRFPGWRGDAPWRMVWLPGAAMSADDVAAQGWDAEAAACGLPIDMLAIDLQARAFDGADAIDALVTDWLRPARATVQRLWLGGLSLGGWQSVLCASRHPELLDGLCLLAPYPGDRLAWGAIERAGGLDAWPGPAPHETDPALAVWAWWRRPPARPRVWMGYGRQDRFADGMDRMAARLDPAQVQRIDGGHDWACWRPLWSAFLATQGAR
jgi:pimeloyl-ACP methyl ester carboxylesterase